MIMTEVFDKLKELQEILSEKYAIQEKILEAPKQLTTQDELLARLKKEFIEKNEVYDKVRLNVSMLKTQLSSAEISRERGEKGMDNISTHREYEALDKEIRDATELEQNIRKELQKEEKHFAELNENLKQDEQLISQQEKDLDVGKASLADEVTALNVHLAELQKKEQEIVPGIDSEIIFKFERIIKSKHSKGIVAVKGNVCDGCHMILPAQFANEVRTGEKIVFCPYCSRILFYQELESGETEFFHLDDAGSLADLDDDFEEEDDGDDDDEETTHDSGMREDLKDMGFDE